jgi:lipoprotein-releasing system permease protein
VSGRSVFSPLALLTLVPASVLIGAGLALLLLLAFFLWRYYRRDGWLHALIAWRYLRRPTDRLISAVGIVSILGLVIGVMALVISMALMTGYRRDLQEKLLGGNAEIFIYAIDGQIHDLPDTLLKLKKLPEVAEAAPVIFQYSLISSEAVTTGEQVMLKGVETQRAVTAPMLAKVFGQSKLVSADGSPGIALGEYLARRLHVKAGEAVTITVPSEHEGSFLPRTSVYTVTNVFRTGFYEFDARWVFVSLPEARRLVDVAQSANLIELKLRPGSDLSKTVAAVDRVTDHQYAVNDWRQMNRQLFSLLAIQQLILFIVIGLIVFVSTFNIVSTLIMTVHEKRREIGILLAMGGGGRMVRRVFVWYGTFVGIIGTLLGLTLGVLTCWIITRYQLISFGPEIAEVYFVSSIPFVTRARDLVIIGLFAAAVSWFATLIPSARSARVEVVEALKAQ